VRRKDEVVSDVNAPAAGAMPMVRMEGRDVSEPGEAMRARREVRMEDGG